MTLYMEYGIGFVVGVITTSTSFMLYNSYDKMIRLEKELFYERYRKLNKFEQEDVDRHGIKKL